MANSIFTVAVVVWSLWQIGQFIWHITPLGDWVQWRLNLRRMRRRFKGGR